MLQSWGSENQTPRLTPPWLSRNGRSSPRRRSEPLQRGRGPGRGQRTGQEAADPAGGSGVARRGELSRAPAHRPSRLLHPRLDSEQQAWKGGWRCKQKKGRSPAPRRLRLLRLRRREQPSAQRVDGGAGRRDALGPRAAALVRHRVTGSHGSLRGLTEADAPAEGTSGRSWGAPGACARPACSASVLRTLFAPPGTELGEGPQHRDGAPLSLSAVGHAPPWELPPPGGILNRAAGPAWQRVRPRPSAHHAVPPTET